VSNPKGKQINVAAHTRSRREQQDAKVVKVATAVLTLAGPDAAAAVIETAVKDMETFTKSYESLMA
jgi:hypothetical protein